MSPGPSPSPTPEENKPPIVVASSSMTFAITDDTIEFTAEGSRDPDGEIVNYFWDLGDDTESEGETISHSYNIPGNYITIVTVVDDNDATTTNDVAPVFVIVDRPHFTPQLDNPPIAIMAASNQIIDEADQVSFDGASSHGWREYRGSIQGDTSKIVSYEWDYGDGTTGNGNSTTHMYSTSGNFLVTLTVTDAEGQTDTVARTIRVLPAGAEYEGQIKNPDTLIFTRDLNVPIMLDPFRMGSQGRNLVLALTDRLVFTGQGDIEPKTEGSLSESWEISEDGLEYTFHLRKGIKFWNGDELTAEDVEYSFERGIALIVSRGRSTLFYERMLGIRPGDPVPKETIQNAIEATDDYTVVFKLVEPYAAFLLDMAYPSWGIVQEKYAIENGAWSWDDPRDFSALDGVDQPMWDGDALMATGPYMVKEKSTGNKIVLERFEDYWQGPAPVKYIRDLYVPEWSTRKLMLDAGDADIIAVHSPAQFEQLVGQPGVNPFMYKYGGFVEVLYFGLDIDPNLTPPENQVPPDFFNDVHMRRAFAYAFPYERYIQEIWLGYAEAAKGVLPEGWPGAYENYPYVYDLEKAEEELKLAHGGKYYDEGFQVAAGSQLWAFETHGRAYEMIGEELAKIDPKFKVVVVGTKWSDMLEMPIGMLVGVIGLDPAWYRNIYHSEYGFERSYGWKNERVDQLIEDSTKTPFMEERLPMLQEAMDIVADECPAILTVFNPHLVAMRDYVSGYYFQVNTLCDSGHYYYISK
jgi:peptide/nickel transport system substrate-binding protein